MSQSRPQRLNQADVASLLQGLSYPEQKYETMLSGSAVHALLEQGYVSAENCRDLDFVMFCPSEQHLEEAGRWLEEQGYYPCPYVKNLFQKLDNVTGLKLDVSLVSHSFESDVAERDFTVAALYVNPEGELLDPTGKGVQDLENRRLRMITAEGRGTATRLQEDPVRFLRMEKYKSKGFELTGGLRKGAEKLSADWEWPAGEKGLEQKGRFLALLSRQLGATRVLTDSEMEYSCQFARSLFEKGLPQRLFGWPSPPDFSLLVPESKDETLSESDYLLRNFMLKLMFQEQMKLEQELHAQVEQIPERVKKPARKKSKKKKSGKAAKTHEVKPVATPEPVIESKEEPAQETLICPLMKELNYLLTCPEKHFNQQDLIEILKKIFDTVRVDGVMENGKPLWKIHCQSGEIVFELDVEINNKSAPAKKEFHACLARIDRLREEDEINQLLYDGISKNYLLVSEEFERENANIERELIECRQLSDSNELEIISDNLTERLSEVEINSAKLGELAIFMIDCIDQMKQLQLQLKKQMQKKNYAYGKIGDDLVRHVLHHLRDFVAAVPDEHFQYDHSVAVFLQNWGIFSAAPVDTALVTEYEKNKTNSKDC